MVARETSLSGGLARMGLQASDQQVSRLALLADLLENDAVDLGFLGPSEGPRVVSRHLLESAALLPFLPEEGEIIDVGSGAGLPGLVLALLGRKLVLVEAQARRADFLRRAIAVIGVDADVVEERAEDAGRGALRDSSSHAVARALAAPAVAMELCLPFVRTGGSFVLPATPGGAEEPAPPDARDRPGAGRMDVAAEEPVAGSSRDRRKASGSDTPVGADPPEADPALVRAADLLGGGVPRWVPFTVPGVEDLRWVMIVDKLRPTPERFPRRSGVPKRRPLGGDVASVH